MTAKREETTPKIPCPYCQGCGRVTLTGLYADTLVALKKQCREVNGAALARLTGVPETAMNNRLVALEKYGLAVGRRNGRERLWSAVKPSTESTT